MATGKAPKSEPKEPAVHLAVAAVNDSGRPLDIDAGDVDTSPTALDLPKQKRRATCSRCGRPAVDRCPQCGSPLCERCAE